jgi:hypothetical protein
MSDSLQPGVKVAPIFVDGEASPAAKFTAIGAQLSRATRKLEAAVGDIHDESYPYSSLNDARLSVEWGRSKTTDAALTGTATRSLDIANLARLIGPSSNLNPKLPAGTVTVTEDIPAGVHEFTLQFPPLALVSSTDAAVVIANSQVAPTTVSGTGDFHRSGSTIYTFDATAGDTITYTLTPSVWGSGPNYTGGTFNVIPDLNQLEAGGDGCVAVLDGDGRYSITLPLCTHLSSNIGGTVIALTAADPLYNEQLILPRVLVDNYVSDEVIPGGFLYLRNWTTGEVYDDATYYYSANDTIIVGGIDLDDAIADGDLLAIVTVGTDITTTLDDLRQKFAYHKHDRSRGEMAIEAEDIVGWTKEPGASGIFTKSVMPGNYAPQYLHRDGFESSEDGLNDNNIMRGDLGLGAAFSDPGDFTDTTSGRVSQSLLFFGGTGGDTASIRRGATGNLEIEAGASKYIETESTVSLKEGLRGDDGDLTAGLYTAKLFVYPINNVTYASGITVDLDALNATSGLSSIATILHGLQVMIKLSTEDRWYGVINNSLVGARDWGWSFNQANWTLSIVLGGGADWGSGPDIDIRIMGWYGV